jgi:ribosome biogenesis GTPase
LFSLGGHTFLFDTPGFSSLKPPEVDKQELRQYFTEFLPYEGQCRYLGCTHIHEPGCVVQQALERGEIGKSRYENYVQIYQEIAELEKQRDRRRRK